MGITNSKSKKSQALKLCKERKRFIKKAIDSRYALSVSHLSYIESLKTIGIALRQFVEVEEHDNKTPLSNYSYPSPSPSPTQSAETMDSLLHSHSSVSYMRTSASPAVTVKIDPVEEDGSFHTPLPPPHTTNSSWDFLDANDELEEYGSLSRLRRFSLDNVSPVSEKKENTNFEKVGLKASCEISVEEKRCDFQQRGNKISDSENSYGQRKSNGGLVMSKVNSPGEARDLGLDSDGSKEALVGKVDKQSCEGRGDPSRFITHGGKDFLSSIKDIENRFFRASECGKEVSRMLETNKVVSKFSDGEGTSGASIFLVALHLACCHRGLDLTSQEPPKQVTKAITWYRSLSSQSSSSRNRLTSASRDDGYESGSDFNEEFSMITGSHSSTLDRLYAWEMKLYAEVKASECVKKKYDQKCNQLRYQFARDASAEMVDKTRAVVKDLHSQIRVGLHATDTIAKRIEKMRDEEVKPQLVELIQGFIRMWKTMLECHQAQYITITLAYHSKSSTTQACGEQYRQALNHLQRAIGCFITSFAGGIDAHKSYVEAVNGWLQNCILLPRERFKGRRVFSPRRALAPPIFVLCRDWSVGIKALPSRGVVHAFEALFSVLHQLEKEQKKQEHLDKRNGPNGDDTKNDKPSNMIVIHPNLNIALDRLTKFTEASLKMCECIRQASEMAEVAYTNCKVSRY
ncbi:nitrate regulatory gene2 protein-like [Papaver somniferum]|uniref:nitrate regulatory gene2 protein-like n=1 Tax=Papaver somniferum TaxID=3469 RepID=UPI000E701793|nr:nitrate regulatory gene2 protein-like [Papaver somniferum]